MRLHFIEEEVSGTEEALHKRPGFQGIIQAIETKSVDGVVAEKLDRFGRGHYLHEFVRLGEKNGVRIIEVDSGEINLRDRNSRMSFALKTLVATEYSLDLKEKIPKKQRSAKVHNGKDSSTTPCLGLDAHPTKACVYVNNLAEGKQVLDIAQKCIDFGGVCYELVVHCERKGYKTKIRWTRERIDKEGNRIPQRQVGGEPFDIKRLHQLLTNPKLRGTGRFLDTWNQFPDRQDEDGYVDFKYAHNPVIPPEVFDKARAVIYEKAAKHGRSGKDRRVYLLAGIFKTSDGRSFQGANHNGGENPYYQTAKRDILIPQDKIEAFIIKRVKLYIRESGVLQDIINTALKHRLTGLPLIEEEMRDTKAKMEALQATLNGFSQALRQAVSSCPSEAAKVTQVLIEERTKAESELHEYQRRLKDLDAKRGYVTTHFQEKTLQEYIKLAMEKFDKQSDQEKKRIIQAIIPSLVYHPVEKRLEIYINPVTEPALKPTIRHAGGNNLRVLENWRTNEIEREEFSAIPQLLDSVRYSHVAPYKDKHFLHQKYLTEGLSLAQIAAQTFSSKEAIRKGLLAAGIKLREPHRPHQRPSQPRYGQRLVNGSVAPHVAEQRTINAILDLHRQRLSLRQIARFLDQIRVPTKCRGKKWHPQMVARIIECSTGVETLSAVAPDYISQRSS